MRKLYRIALLHALLEAGLISKDGFNVLNG